MVVAWYLENNLKKNNIKFYDGVTHAEILIYSDLPAPTPCNFCLDCALEQNQGE